jgi:hypothetical protein
MEEAEEKKPLGYRRLAQKSLALLTSSMAALLGTQDSKAVVNSHSLPDLGKRPTYEHYQKKILHPQLVLKFNPFDPESSMLTMHTSHRSHSSHSSHSSHVSSSTSSGHYSHSSHTSHVSHYSSSPTYSTPTLSTYPTTSPSQSSPIQSQPINSRPTSTPASSGNGQSISSDWNNQRSTPSVKSGSATYNPPYFLLGSRILRLGCIGTDVLDVQKMLLALGYDLEDNGSYDLATEKAVELFQSRHSLRADGEVGPKTLSILQTSK